MAIKRAVGRPRRSGRTSEATCEENRRYHREYMRRLRADPLHRDRQREKRQYDSQKSALVRTRPSRPREVRGQRLCGICGVRAAVGDIARLLISETAESGYAGIVIPYCGKC